MNVEVQPLKMRHYVAREIRTLDLRFRRPLLYPAELLRQINTNNYMKYSLPSQCLIVVFVGIVSKFMINWLKRLHFY